jgi:multidrug efflux pump subunit AcrA (membrane-fusion protein)
MRPSDWKPAGFGRTLALAVLLPALVACAVAPAGSPPVAPLSVRTTPVADKTIAGTVICTGNVEARTKVNLVPKIAGQIVTLNVETGSVVKQGEVIAELDHAVQDAHVAQAAAGLAAAQAKLATIEVGPRAEVVAQARANLQAAEANLTFMQNGGRPENVTAAQGNLATAAGKLAGLQQGRSEAVAQATANVQGAQACLQQFKDGPTPDQVGVAQQAVEAAKVAAFGADVNKDGACNKRNSAYLCNAARAQADAAHRRQHRPGPARRPDRPADGRPAQPGAGRGRRRTGAASGCRTPGLVR